MLSVSLDSTDSEASPVVPPPEPAGRRRILLAEDSQDIQRLITLYLQPTAHLLEIAEDGRAAVEKFISSGFDLVLMDLEMPVMDGYTAARKMRDWEAQRGGRPARILALTGAAIEEDLQGLFDAYLTKPIQRDAVVVAVAEHLRDAINVFVPKGIEELVPGYLQKRSTDLRALVAALERGDYETIRVLGHNMKGSGNGYGFAAISAIGGSLERAAQQESADAIRTQIAALADFLRHMQGRR